MVNAKLGPVSEEPRAGDVAVLAAPRRTRAGFAALLAVDDALAGIVRSTTQPLVGQMRLTWWHGALAALDDAPPPAEPVLRALAAAVVPRVPGAVLATLVEGWEVLLEPDPLPDEALEQYAAARGGALFSAAATVLGSGATAQVRAAGRRWALLNLAAHVGDAALAARCRALAGARGDGRWPRALRSLGVMERLAEPGGAHGLRGAVQVAWLRMTGL